MDFLHRWRARLLGKSKTMSGFTAIRTADGSIMHVDELTLQYLKSTKPNPTQESLDKVLSKARRVRVLPAGVGLMKTLKANILFETDQQDTLSELGEALRIVDGPAGHCMCIGNADIELIGSFNRRLAVISVHHGVSIRWNAWKDDAELVQGRLLLERLAKGGVTHPLEEFEESLHRQKAEEEEWERWLAATPACLRDFVAEMDDSVGWATFVPAPDSDIGKDHVPSDSATLVPLLQALEGAYPDLLTRVRTLFGWFGSGEGRWSGFPSYETVAEELLMTFPINDLLGALESPDLREAEVEGAARLFASWEFRTKRAQDVGSVPQSTKQMLLEQAMKSTDSDKRSRAEAAFGIA